MTIVFSSYFGQVRLRRLDHAFDIPAGGIIDEWIMTVPPGVAAVKDIRFDEVGRDIAVSMARAVIGERDGGAIDEQCLFFVEHFGGNRAGGRGREGEIPGLHSRRRGEMLSSVLVGEDVAPSACIHSLPSV